MAKNHATKGMCLAWALGLLALGLAAQPLAAQHGAPQPVGPADGCTVKGPGSGLVQLQWQPVEGAFAYEIRIHQTSGEYQDYVRLERRNRLNFGTAVEGEYQWQVRALLCDPDVPCPTGESQPSFGPWGEMRTLQVKSQVGSTWQGDHRPQVMFPRQGGSLVDGNNYNFQWAPVDGAYQYEVCLNTPSGTECHLVSCASYEYRSAQWSGPRNGAEPTQGHYQLRVRAISEDGAGEYCEPIQYLFNYGGDHGDCWNDGVSSAPAPVLLAPEDGSTLNPTPDGFLATLQWEPVEAAVYYEIKFRAHEQHPGEGHMGQGQHGMGVPPTSALVEEPLYDLVIPEATPGTVYVWKVRAIIPEGEDLLATEFSDEWQILVGTVEEPAIAGEPIVPDAFDSGTSFAGPGAQVEVDWKDAGDQLCQVTLLDATGIRIVQTYRRGSGWNVELPNEGGYFLHIRKMDQDRDGTVASMTPLGEGRSLEVGGNAVVDGGRRLGDLVSDGSVDSGDAVRALRQSADQLQTQLTLRDASCGDCNGDGLIDSGDAVYMLRKAVGPNR